MSTTKEETKKPTPEELKEMEEERQRQIKLAAEEKLRENWKRRFQKVAQTPIEIQYDFFLKRYIFTLNKDDEWKKVRTLRDEFMIAAQGDGILEPDECQEILTKHNLVRPPEEYLTDVEGSLSFVEFLSMKYKIMILKEYYQRRHKEPDIDLSGDGSNIRGQSIVIMEELFSPPAGLDPELERLMEEFSIMYATRERREQELKYLASLGGVKGMTAQNQLNALKAEDQTALHAVEAKIGAAVKRSQKATEDELNRVLALEKWQKENAEAAQ